MSTSQDWPLRSAAGWVSFTASEAQRRWNEANEDPEVWKMSEGIRKMNMETYSSNWIISPGIRVKIKDIWIHQPDWFLLQHTPLFAENSQFDEHIFQMGGSTTK